MNKHWTLIEAYARDLGVKRTAISNWRRLGVPRMWRYDLHLLAKANGRRLPPESFEGPA